MRILSQLSKSLSIATGRSLWGYLLLYLLAVAIAVPVFSRLARNQMVENERQKMVVMVKMLANYLDNFENGIDDPRLQDSLRNLGDQTDSFLSVIDDAGVVLADSIDVKRIVDSDELRGDILDARASEISFSHRFDERMLYLTNVYQRKRVDQRKGFLRVAISSNAMDQAIGSIQRVVWSVAIIGSVLTGLLMTVYSARSMSPLSAFAKSARRIGAGDHDTSL